MNTLFFVMSKVFCTLVKQLGFLAIMIGVAWGLRDGC